jgi:uncharacterized protein YhaN
MINNKIIETELNDLEREMSDLLMRISELKKEVHKLIKTDSKIVYEQYITTSNNGYYNVKSRISEHTKIIHIIKEHIMYFHKKCPLNLYLNGIYDYSSNVKKLSTQSYDSKIIETYIPSKNLLLVVEL